MLEISQKRIEELVIRAMDKEAHRARIEYALRVAIRIGIREGLEVAAQVCGQYPTIDGLSLAYEIRAITIEGERRND